MPTIYHDEEEAVVSASKMRNRSNICLKFMFLFYLFIFFLLITKDFHLRLVQVVPDMRTRYFL